MIWLSAFSYATDDALMNCGARTLVSNVQRLRAFAGSWMSRTTTVGSPVTVPIAMLSPAGTVPTQWTRVAGPGAPLGFGVVELDGVVAVAAADADAFAVGECDAVGVEPPHAATARDRKRAAPVARTR